MSEIPHLGLLLALVGSMAAALLAWLVRRDLARRALVAEVEARMRQEVEWAERRERQAAQREALLQATFDRMDQGLMTRDGQGVITAANRRLLEMFELPAAALLGRRLDDVLRELAAKGEYGSGADPETVVRERIDRNNTPSYRSERTRPNGVVLEMWANPLPDGGRLMTYTDVTERRRNERALKESEARYRALANAAQVGIWHVGADHRSSLYANPAMLRLLEVGSAEEIQARGIDSFFPPGSREKVSGERQRRQAGKAGSYEVELLGARGGRRPILISGAPLFDDDGRFQGTIGVYTDLTEERAREEQLRQAQKLEMVGQLTGGVAHDFNNLLAAILGNLELLGERVQGESESRMIATSVRAARRGAELTQRLLSFARRQPLRPRAVDVVELVSGMVEMLRRLLGETIRIETAFEEALPAALVDPAQLEAALVNLAVNARDAMPEGGSLRILAKAAAEDMLAIEVRDDGVGMSAEVASRAFEPFFTTKDVGKGSGLGLSMVHGFVNQSGGRVELSSEPGCGASVRLLLPRAPSPQAAAEETASTAPHPRGGGKLVLLVEDNDDVRRLAAEMLADLDYRVIEAPDGPCALELFEGHPEIAVLLTDVMLPNGVRGTALARTVKERRPDVACICMSGYDEEAARPGGGTRLLAKPFRKGELARALAAALGGDAGD